MSASALNKHLGGVGFKLIIFVRLEHPVNTLLSKYAIDLPMVIEVRLLQLLNAPQYILSTELGRTMELRSLQRENAYSQIVVIELGMESLLMRERENANFAIVVTPSGILNSDLSPAKTTRVVLSKL